MTPADLLGVAEELADVADAITLAAFRSHLQVRTKADGSWVTDADERVERALRDQVAQRLPGHAFFGEEHGGARDGPVPTWIVDPIDGTSNFVRGNPVFATLIAVRVDGDELAAVVSAPALGSRWTAARGHGTQQDGRKLAVSAIDRISDAEVATGDPRYLADAGVADAVRALGRDAARQRGYGDFWQHCLVAAGSTDVALEADVKVWDLAAVKLVVEEAGGMFTTFDGRRTADGPTALSTNGRLHDAVLARLAG